MKLSMLKLPAPAKLNAFLHVVGRRPDGYHTLESLFVPIDRCDRISLEVRGDGAIVRSKGPDSIVPEEDLVVRAARLGQRGYFFQESLFKFSHGTPLSQLYNFAILPFHGAWEWISYRSGHGESNHGPGVRLV